MTNTAPDCHYIQPRVNRRYRRNLTLPSITAIRHPLRHIFFQIPSRVLRSRHALQWPTPLRPLRRRQGDPRELHGRGHNIACPQQTTTHTSFRAVHGPQYNLLGSGTDPTQQGKGNGSPSREPNTPHTPTSYTFSRPFPILEELPILSSSAVPIREDPRAPSAPPLPLP